MTKEEIMLKIFKGELVVSNLDSSMKDEMFKMILKEYRENKEKTDKAFSWITLMLMDNDVSKEKALITIKNVLSNEMEGKTIL